MKTIYCTLLATIISFLFITTLPAQKPPMKFGKIEENNLRNDGCPIDSAAHAHFIFDFGYSYFEYANTRVETTGLKNNSKGFQLYYNRHFRIKINDNQGYGWADIRIPLYYDESEEKITRLKAVTYNYENGKVVKTKINNSDLVIEETRDHWKTAKLAMPNVKKGSIIEVEYTIKSDYFFNLQEWYFQRSIPVLQSDYHVYIPEYYHFNQTQKGYFPIDVEESKRSRELTITYIQKAMGLSVKADKYTKKFKYMDAAFHYAARDVPAFPAEKHLRTIDNYLTKIEFELNSTQFPGQPVDYYTVSWEKVDDTLLKSYAFGKELDKTGHLKDIAEEILKQTNNSTPELLLITEAYNYIRKHLVWNGQSNKYVETSLRKAFNEGGGNCAEINLNLVALLRTLGVKSHPVTLSTQKHGIIHPAHPSVSRFNYVIAMAEIDGEMFLMDATDPHADINLLPTRCLNDKGRVIGNVQDKWIDLMNYKSYISFTNYKLALTEELNLAGKATMSLKEYGSYLQRKEIKKSNDPDQFANTLKNNFPGAKVQNVHVEGLDSLADNMTVEFDLAEADAVNSSGDMIFFSPCVTPFFKENPFKLQERQYPVEFNYPYQIFQSYEITIPESYEISEIPKQQVVNLLDQAGMFAYQIFHKDNVLTVSSTVFINRSIFLPAEYEYIRNFFQIIIDTQNELVVLKKI